MKDTQKEGQGRWHMVLLAARLGLRDEGFVFIGVLMLCLRVVV